MGKKHYLAPLLIILIGAASFFAISIVNGSIVKKISNEGSIVEISSALFYFFGVVICAYRIAKKSHEKKILLYLWMVLCFFFFGEEISWFQHLLKYSTPEFVSEANYQNEFNIHNLEICEGGSWREALTTGKFDYRLFLSSDGLFRLGFFLYFLIIPLFMYTGKFTNIRNKLGYHIPEKKFLISLYLVMLFSFIPFFLKPEITDQITEVREMFYAFFIFLYIYVYLRKVPKTLFSN